MRSVWLSIGIVGCLLAGGAFAAQKSEKPYDKMNYGPYLSASIISEPNPEFDNSTGNFTTNHKSLRADISPRGYAIRLTEDWHAGIVFEADSCRMTAAWIGGPLIFKGLIGDGAHGPGPTLSVKPTFKTPFAPGWADKNGSFKEPREDSIPPLPPPGNLPADWAKYRGLYLNGEKVIVSYTVGACAVLETPSLEKSGDLNVFARTFTLAPSSVAQALMVAEAVEHVETSNEEMVEVEKTIEEGGKKVKKKVKETKKVTSATEKPAEGKIENGIAHAAGLHVALVGAPAGAMLEVVNGQIHLKLPARQAAETFKVLVANGGDATKAAFEALAKDSAKPTDLNALTKGGPSHWNEVVETQGVVATPADNEAYVVDKLTIPYKNPYDSYMRTAAFDFFSDGTRAAISTWSGDVWIVSGIDESLAHLKWKRFATGLHQPLGLKIVNDEVDTVGHDQITKLVDLNGDGEADFYQCFNNSWELTSAFHAFAFDLHTDPEGNFFFAFGSPVQGGGRGFHRLSKDHGKLFKVSKDGSKIETYATGLRAPNGMCVSPTGQVTIGDNEGSWVPTSPLHWVKPGAFLGVADSAHGAKVEQPKPLMWLSHNGGVDNSCGGQAWVTSDKWGPYKNYLLHLSYGTSSLFLVMPQEVNGQMQGAGVKIPVKFTSSAMRARFNAKDGQLYIVGLKGWQTNAAADGGFDRVRYTGKPVHLPMAFKATSKGMYVTYATKLDQAYANDAQNFSAEAWNYLWTSNYGSPEVSLSYDPKDPTSKKGNHDTFTVKSAKLQDDGKTVFLEIPDIKPCMQFRIKSNIKAADGVDMKQDVFGTIYNLPAE